MRDPSRIYRLLLRLYPARFREEYAEPLEVQFQDDYSGVRSRPARIVFWARVLRDLVISIPAEIAHELAQDVRISARVYKRRPLATGLAVVALAMAIGVTTGVFSVLNGVMFRGLPFRDPERLVHLQEDYRFTGGPMEATAWGDRSRYFAGTAEFSTAEMTMNQTAGASRVTVTEATSELFRVLGVEPELGRSFARGEDARGANGVALISHGLWLERFGGDAGVLGSTVRVNGIPLTIIGVAPAGFDFPARTALWSAGLFRLPRGFGVVGSETIARLKPGFTVAQARAMFTAELLHASPELSRKVQATPPLRSLRDELAGPVRRASSVLFAAVLLVLCIACANIAQLLLSRTNERRQEMSIRAALGASRSRLVQQLITEATALTLTGAVLGLPVAWWTSLAASRVEPAPLAAQTYALLDWRVLMFMASATLVTGAVFGVLPALAIRRGHSVQEIVRSQPGVSASGVGRIRVALVALQAALTVVLLLGCIVMSRSFLTLLGADLGFRTDRVVTMRAFVEGIFDDNRQIQFYNAALERMRATAGVEAAGAVRYLPLIDSDWKYLGARYVVESGHEVAGQIVRGNSVTAGYFQAMGIDLLAGRDFTTGERRGKTPVAIVDDAFARRSGLGAGIVGKAITWYAARNTKYRHTIVGVVRATRLGGPAAKPAVQVYVPVEQSPPGYMTFVARVRGPAIAYLRICQAAVQRVDPTIPIYDAQTLEQRLSGNLLRPRFYTTTILFLGAFALLLAVIGIYGVAAYSVTQRTHEIGVRIAIGAAPGEVRAAIVRQSMLPVLTGMAAGVAGAIASGRFLKSLMSSAEPLGIQTCILGGLLLSATALAAIWFATSRVTQVDPMEALKSE